MFLEYNKYSQKSSRNKNNLVRKPGCFIWPKGRMGKLSFFAVRFRIIGFVDFYVDMLRYHIFT